MVKTRRETENDDIPDGENLTAEQLDVASIELLRAFSDFGLRRFSAQCRHWQMMAEFELEERKLDWRQ